MKYIFAPMVVSAGIFLKNKDLAKCGWKMDKRNLRGLEKYLRLNGNYSEQLVQFELTINMMAHYNDLNQTLIKNNLPYSKSQLLQDIFVILTTDAKKNGFFVEVGVGNGVDISNTYMLESRYNWKGLLVEPNRMFHNHITTARHATLDKRAAFNESGQEIDFLADQTRGEFSSLVLSSNRDGYKRDGEIYKVQTVTLDDLLEEHNAPQKIDYISIDTEGSETDILQGINLDRWWVGIITVEHNMNRRRVMEFKNILEPNGYHAVFSDLSMFETWFIHNDLYEEHIEKASI